MSKKITQPRNLLGIIDEFLRIVTLGKQVKDYTTDSDLLSLTKFSRIEPLCVVSKSLVNSSHYKNILMMNLNIFASLYISAVPMINVIGKTKVGKLLGQLNPDRDLDTFVGLEDNSSYGVLAKDYQFGLPSSTVEKRLELLGEENGALTFMGSPTEYSLDSLGFESLSSAKDSLKELANHEVFKGDKHTAKSTAKIDEDMAVAVGKQITITLQHEEVEMPVNVSLKLTAIPVDGELIGSVLNDEATDSEFTERYHKWRSGRITFFKDFMLALDLLENHKKLMMKDDIGFYEEAIRRSRNGKIWGVLLRAPSLAEASNIYIIDRAIRKSIESKYRGKFKSEKIRKRIFGVTRALIFCVVDEDMGVMDIYYRNIPEPSRIRLKDIAKASKKDDMLELVAVLNKSQAPVF